MRGRHSFLRTCGTLPTLALALGGVGQDGDTLLQSFTAFADNSPSLHVALDLENDVLVVARATGDSGTVRVHWRDAGGLDQWEAIAVLHEGIPGFGHSIDLHDGLLAVGIDANDGASNGPFGSVRIYRVDPLAPEQVVALDTLLLDADDGAYPSDRFGRTVRWQDDLLLVGAIGCFNTNTNGTGAVYLFERDDDQWGVCGSLRADSTLQATVLGAFGEVIATAPGHIVIGAPFSGYTGSFSDPQEMDLVLGSLHPYRRGTDSSDPCDWVQEGTVMDITPDPMQVNSYFTLETGRQGIAFNDEELIAHISANYTLQGAYYLDDEQRAGPPLRPACDHCGLRSFNETGPGIWSVTDSSLLTIPDDLAMGLGAWTVHDHLLFVNQFDTTTGEWSTRLHSRDQDGQWVERDTIDALPPESDAVFNTPLAAHGPWLVRLPSTLDTSSGMRTIGVEIFRLGTWTGMRHEAPAHRRLNVFPNPTPGTCSLELPAGTRWSIELDDPTGRLVRSFQPLSGGLGTIDLSGLPPGIYTLVAHDEQRTPRLFSTIAVRVP